MKYLSVKEIAEKAGCDKQHIYYLTRVLGRIPTVKEARQYEGKRGRPPKHFSYQPKEQKETKE